MAPRVRWLLVLSASMLIAPALAHGQDRAGVVTTLEGNVTATRSAVAQPVALKFKDDVFLNDRITTGDRSIARLLLGGKAVVTIRERSSLTITELPGRSTIALDSGKIAVAVAREKMRPGEQVEVRTPNAVAGVRGTVFVVEVTRASAQGVTQGPTPGLSPGVTTLVYGYVGSVLLHYADAAGAFTRQVVLGAGEFASGTGFAPPTTAVMTPEVAARGRAGLESRLRSVGGATLELATSRAMEATVTTLAAAGISAPAPSTFAGLVPPSVPNVTVPLLPGGTAVLTRAAPTPVPPPPSAGVPPPPSVLFPFPEAIQLSPSIAPFTIVQAAASVPVVSLTSTTTVSTSTDTLFSLPIDVTAGLDRPLLGATNGTVNADRLLSVDGTLTSRGTGALVMTDPTTMTFSGDVFAVPGSLAVMAPLMSDTGGTLNVGDNVLGVNGILASPTASALFQLTNTTVSATNPAEPGRFLEVVGTVALGGPLLSASNSNLTLANFLEVSGGRLVGSGSSPLVDLSGGSLTVLKREVDPETELTQEDGLFMSVEAGGAETGGAVTLAGQLLKARTTPLAMGTLLEVESGSSLTSTTLAPLVELIDSPLRSQGQSYYSPGSIVERGGGLMDITGTMTLAGPLFKATGSPIVTGDAFEVDGTLTSTTSAALVQLINSPLRAEEREIDEAGHAVFLRVGGAGTLRLKGPLLSATDSDLTILDALVRVEAGVLPGVQTGGQIITSGTTDPLVSLTRGTHAISGSLFELTGRSEAVATETVQDIMVDGIPLTLPLGSDRPVQHGGVLFETSAATVTASQAIRLDTALLEAMAPVLNLTAGSALTTALDVVNLVNKAKLVANVPADALVTLNASRLMVTSGSLLNVAGGSSANIVGNLVRLDNGSTVTIWNGALVTVSDNSVFKLTGGSLAVFGSGNNALNIVATPACAGCILTTIAGIQVLKAEGATVAVSPGFKAFAGGTPNVAPGAAVLVVKDTSKVRLGF